MARSIVSYFYWSGFFFFNDTATTEIYTLSLHDALPISRAAAPARSPSRTALNPARLRLADGSGRSEEHTSELQSQSNLVCRLLLEKKIKPQMVRQIHCRRINPVGLELTRSPQPRRRSIT